MAKEVASQQMMKKRQDPDQTVDYHVSLWGHTTDLFPWMVAHGIVECGQVIAEEREGQGQNHICRAPRDYDRSVANADRKGLRELMVSLSCELSFRGDVREQNEEVQLEYEAMVGKAQHFHQRTS